MPVPHIHSGLGYTEAFKRIRDYVRSHDGPMAKQDVMDLVAATIRAAAIAAGVSAVPIALRLRTEAERMK